MTNLYPESPGPLYSGLLESTTVFRLQLVKVIGFIAIFFLLYVVVLLTAVTLATAFIVGGIVLIAYYHNIYTVILGLALSVLGGMVLFFLIRFLFNKNTPVNPYRTEIHAGSHPQLFDFIARLVGETRITFPQKIFVVPEVSANVFYKTTFLSLLWPARKNLEIGLGLVNSLNISEFKMVLAREFAHFSRRSMKLGSYVYTLNKVLYNMLYENHSWNEMMIRWSGNGSLPGFFAHITTLIVNGMQYLLRKLYHLINRQYMELSREMEFRADALAVSLAGTAAAISSIRRMEMSSYCMDSCMHKLQELAECGQRFSNVFSVQRALITYYAGQNNIQLDAQELPLLTDSYFHTFLKSRVQLREQWASHPTREDREARYRQANILSEPATGSAWQLFSQPETLQQQSTQQLYDLLEPDEGGYDLIETATFVNSITQRHRLYEYPKAFNDYYDNRSFAPMPEDTFLPYTTAAEESISMQEIYHPEVIRRMRRFYRDQQDVETLQAIALGQFQTRFFEFDGRKYRAAEARILARKLAMHVEQEQRWLASQDRLAIRYHYNRALHHGPEAAAQLQEKYRYILMHQAFANRLNDQVVHIIHHISQLFNIGAGNIDQVWPCVDELTKECWNFRRLLHEVMNSKGYSGCLTEELYNRVMQFRQQDCVFVNDHVPDYAAIQELHEITSSVMEQYNNSNILYKKLFLEFLLRSEPVG